MTRTAVIFGSLVLALAVAAGCNKKGEELAAQLPVVQVDAEVVPDIPEPDGGLTEPTEEGESTAAADAIVEQMKTAGITDDGLKKTGAKYGAKNCLEGKLNGIPTVMCEYADVDAAKANRSKAEGFAKGAVTGAVERNGKTIIAVKTTGDLDKSGEKVNKIIAQFSKAK